jgi:RNA polymerase sigma-70 factor (ECF subfamily)
MINLNDCLNQDLRAEEIRNGSSDALSYVFKQYYSPLYDFAQQYVEDREPIEDIIQDCFTKIWEDRENLLQLPILALIYTMVRNGCMALPVQSPAIERHDIEYTVKNGGKEEIHYSEILFDKEYADIYEETESQIRLILDSMPEQLQEIFLLNRFDNLSVREISERLSVSERKVRDSIAQVITAFAVYFRDRPRNLYIIILSWVISE